MFDALFCDMQLTWTVRTASSMLTLKPAEEVLVSYLPLSHVAAQLVDMWLCVSFAMTTYFADPDALKVRMPTVVLKKNSSY